MKITPKPVLVAFPRRIEADVRAATIARLVELTGLGRPETRPLVDSAADYQQHASGAGWDRSWPARAATRYAGLIIVPESGAIVGRGNEALAHAFLDTRRPVIALVNDKIATVGGVRRLPTDDYIASAQLELTL